MSSATSPALPAFSYAQAARGLTPSHSLQPKSPELLAAPTENSPKESKTAPLEPAKLELTSTASSPKTENHSINDTGANEIKAEPQGASLANEVSNKENVPPQKETIFLTDEAKQALSGPSSPLSGVHSQSVPPKDDEVSQHQTEPSETWDRQSQSSTNVDKSAPASEKGKAKENEDDWEKISLQASSIEKELRAAPIPVVNIWQQRKEAQEAKARELANQRPAMPPPAAPAIKSKSSSNVTPDETKRKVSDKIQPPGEKEGSISKKRQQQQLQQEANRSNEGNRREQGQSNQSRTTPQRKPSPETTAPPPVGDAETWPTPETALTDDRRKSTSLDKGERIDAKLNGSKSHGKQWIQVPFVPTAVFETQLPAVAARRGGRPSNRGREGAGRGGANVAHTAAGEKAEPNTSMGPPPVPKLTEQERGRKTEANRGGRATSVPTQGRRNTSTPSMTSDVRKVSETPGRDRTTVSQSKTTFVESPKTAASPEGDTPAGIQNDQSISRPLVNVAASTNSNSVPNAKPSTPSDDTHAHPAAIENGQRSVTGEWPKGTNQLGQRGTGDSTKERTFNKGRELTREKPDLNREKVESWRDREPQADQPPRRESRSERGRGSYRGRGSHSNFAAHTTPNQQSYTAPLPQQPFPPSKSNSFQEGRHRQVSQPYPAMQPSSGSRGSIRSQSIPTGSIYTPFSNGAPIINQPLSPIQTDMPMFTYAPMQPSIMSAMPYNSALDSFALISMVSTQLEYYFSIDNLCKDMFLRKHMDSDGYVSISVIAGFKRIRSLTDDMHLLRSVCSQLKNVEYMPGENGEEDRLRRREGWENFVLAPEERVSQPAHDQAFQQNQMARRPSHSFGRFVDPSFSTMDQMRSPAWAQGMYNGPTMSPQTSQSVGPPYDVTSSKTALSPNLPEYPRKDLPATAETEVSSQSQDTVNPSASRRVNGVGSPNITNGHAPQSVTVGLENEGGTEDENENIFPNDQIQALTVVVRKNDETMSSSEPRFMSDSTRTFSQGSLDPRAEAGASVLASGLRGGAGSPEQLDHVAQQHGPFPGRGTRIDSSPIFWVKETVGPVGLHYEGLAHEPYLNLHGRALEQRLHGHLGEDMEVLYQFWSHFLIRNFNVAMYREFHTLALKDLENGRNSGSNHLVRYYGHLLSGQLQPGTKTLTDRLILDIVAMAEKESGDTRPAFWKLRSAWRNGAFNMKSRKRIDNILPSSLRAELEK